MRGSRQRRLSAKEPLGADREHDQEQNVSAQYLVLRTEVRAELLCDTERHPADERPPQRANAADDDRLEGVEQVDAAARRV